MNEKAANNLVKDVIHSKSKWQLMYEMSVRRFYSLKYPLNVPSNNDWFLFKYVQPESMKIKVQGEPVELLYGDLHTLHCENKPFGMLLSLPKMKHKLLYECLITLPKSLKNVDELDDKAELLYTNDQFSIMVLDDRVQYVAAYCRELQSNFN